MPKTFHCPHCLAPIHFYEAGEAVVRCPACAKVAIAPKAFRPPPEAFTLQPVSSSRFFGALAALGDGAPAANQ